MPPVDRFGAFGVKRTRTSWFIRYPHEGHPSLKAAALPSNPHLGQRTPVKLLPQYGHTPAFALTSREQFPQ